MALAKIETYKVRQRGERGLEVSIPQVWAKDNDVEPGDILEIFRETDDNSLVIRKAPKEEPTS